MRSGTVERELLAPPADVWAFVSDAHNFGDWWPGVAAAEPDRRGALAGARWRVRASGPGWTRSRDAMQTLVVVAAEPRQLISFELTGERVRATLRLMPAADGRTRARLEVERPWLSGSPKRIAGDALTRLHALCQTAAEL